ncbi:alpha/beta hydrolase [Marinactinospora thermotolerans]|uniref:Alpha/beta hydrolase n=1 Tax=Marinactinospora thermotolerans DSM 45154 TaxID=1122192 RepID=A0A1T4SBL1_9ACTN|nr:alpha/beta hydrolase [Marinactinospora thermotolerans]SKA25700.1 Alpha/beta hydrolase [Marinactinospora thermotolerans DSM 45154]
MTTRLLTLLAAVAAFLGCGAAWLRPAAPADPVEPLRYEARTVGGRLLLADDPEGGRIVEVLGDLDGADAVAVIVPGSGQNRDVFRDNPEHPGTAPLANARALWEELRRQRPGAEVAVVAWLGYRAPQDAFPDAVTLVPAREGARELARLRRELPADARVSLVCHSYGAVVCGLAAREAGVADEVVALAAPGLGVGSVADVRARVWSVRAPDDWIRFVPSLSLGPIGLGADPMAPDSPARVVASGPISGHESYYQPGSESLANVARVVLGDLSSVTPARS